jgi:hypothetical protein
VGEKSEVENQKTKTQTLKNIERWFKDDKNKGWILTAHPTGEN